MKTTVLFMFVLSICHVVEQPTAANSRSPPIRLPQIRMNHRWLRRAIWMLKSATPSFA